jgi:hypothetical protein
VTVSYVSEPFCDLSPRPVSHYHAALWRFREARLYEVLIERKGRADAQPLHHDEGDASVNESSVS